MYSLILLASTAFILALLLTPLVRNAARRWKIVDTPDETRKLHGQPVPRVGGVVIALTYLLSYAVLLMMQLHGGYLVRDALPFFMRISVAAALIFATGLLDDLRGLNPWQKLLGQVAAALAACWAGVSIANFGSYHLDPWLAVPITVVWLLACTNAFNLIDGVDGLAAGVGLFATITMLLAALLQNNVPLALATVPLAGALLGFLRYNFNPATIFLGDSGSLLIGFLLGCYGVLWSQKSATILGITAPMMALAIPLLDTSLAIVRRFLRQKPIFTADRGHIHHRLLDRGFTPRKVALMLYAVCGLFATMSLCTVWAPNVGIVIVLFCACTWIGIQHLGYVEFGVAGRMFVEGAFRRLLNSQIALQTYEDRLKSAGTPEECWNIIESASKDFGFHRADVSLAGHTFQWQHDVEPVHSWEVNIPLSESDFVCLRRPFGGSGQPNVVAPLADTLRRTLTPKLPQFAAMSNVSELQYQTAGQGGD